MSSLEKDQKRIDMFVDAIAAQEKRTHDRIASGKYDTDDPSEEREEKEEQLLLAQDMNAFRKVKIPGVDFDLEPIPIQVIEVNEVEEHDIEPEDAHEEAHPPHIDSPISVPDHHQVNQHPSPSGHQSEASRTESHPSDYLNSNDHRDPEDHPSDYQSPVHHPNTADHRRPNDHPSDYRNPVDHPNMADHRSPNDHPSDYRIPVDNGNPDDHRSHDNHPNDFQSSLDQTIPVDHSSSLQRSGDAHDAHDPPQLPEPPHREHEDDHHEDRPPEAPKESPEVHFYPLTTPNYDERPVRNGPEFHKNKFDDNSNENNDDKRHSDSSMDPKSPIKNHSDSYSDDHPIDSHYDDRHSGTLPHSHVNDFSADSGRKYMPSNPYNDNDRPDSPDNLHEHQIELIEQHDPGSGQNSDKTDKVDDSPPNTNPNTYIRQLMPHVFDQSPIVTPESDIEHDLEHHHNEQNDKPPGPERRVHNEDIPERTEQPNGKDERKRNADDSEKEDENPMIFRPTEPNVGARGDHILKYYEDQSKVDSKRLTRLAESEANRRAVDGSQLGLKDSIQFKNYKNTNEPQVIDENKRIDKRVGYSSDFRSDGGHQPIKYYEKPSAGARLYAKQQEYHSYDQNPTTDEEEPSDGHNDELNASYDRWSDEHLKLVEEELKKPIEAYNGKSRSHQNVDHNQRNEPLNKQIPDSDDYEKARVRTPSDTDLRNDRIKANKPKGLQRHQPQYPRPQPEANEEPRDRQHGSHDKTESDQRFKNKNRHEDNQKYDNNQQFYTEKEFNDKDYDHNHDEDPDDGHYHHSDENTPPQNQRDRLQEYRSNGSNDFNQRNKIPSKEADFNGDGDQLYGRVEDEFRYELPEKSSDEEKPKSGPEDGLSPHNITRDFDGRSDTDRHFEPDSEPEQEMSGPRNEDRFASDERSHQSSSLPSDTESRKEYEPQRNRPHIDIDGSRHRHNTQHSPHSYPSHPFHPSLHSRRSHQNSYSSQPQRDSTQTKAHSDQRSNNYDRHVENNDNFRQNSGSRLRTPDEYLLNSQRTSQQNHRYDDDNRKQHLERPQKKYEDRNRRTHSRGWPQYYDEERAATTESQERADPKSGKMWGSESMNVETQTNSSIDWNNDNNTIAIKDIDSADAWVKPLSLKTKLMVIEDKNDTTVAEESKNANDAEEKIFRLRSNDKQKRNITRKPKLQKLINLHNIANKSLIYDMLTNASNSTQFDSQRPELRINAFLHSPRDSPPNSPSEFLSDRELENNATISLGRIASSEGTGIAGEAQRGVQRGARTQRLSRTVRTRPQRSISHQIINSVRNSNHSDNYKSTKNALNIRTNFSLDVSSTTTNIKNMPESEEPKCSKVSSIDGLCFGNDYDYPLQSITKSLLKNLQDISLLRRRLTSRSVNDSSSEADRQKPCPTLALNVRPMRARNINGLWKVIVNIEGVIEQTIRISQCREPLKECKLNGQKCGSKCIQKQSSNDLIAYNEENSAFEIDIFHIPSVCMCSVCVANDTNII